MSKKQVIGIDFDGTSVTHEFPKIGKNTGAQHVLKQLVKEGHHIVLFTMRSDRSQLKIDGLTDKAIHNVTGNFLTDAVNWFRDNDIPLYGINVNPTQSEWTTSPKAYCHLYIDDAALGVPLVFSEGYSDKPYVDWLTVYIQLHRRGLVTEPVPDALYATVEDIYSKYKTARFQ